MKHCECYYGVVIREAERSLLTIKHFRFSNIRLDKLLWFHLLKYINTDDLLYSVPFFLAMVSKEHCVPKSD